MNESNNSVTTLGPWRLDDGTHEPILQRDQHYHFIDAGCGFYCSGKDDGFSIAGHMSLANAQLITDAPAMLEVLQQIVHEYDQTYDADGEGGNWRGAASVPNEVMRRAKALVERRVTRPARVITLTEAEIQSNHNRVQWAAGLIRQLPATHEGRNSWLLNYASAVDSR